MLVFAGVTPMDTRVAGVTVRGVEPNTPFKSAVIVVEPAFIAAASPLELDPGMSVIDATLDPDVLHVTELVRSCVELSLYTPVALNALLVPLGKLEFAGVMPMDTRVAAVTFRVVAPDTPLKVAVIMADPGLIAATTPFAPGVFFTSATVAAEELQVTAVVRSCVELSV
jgi:hypothetical protein